ncbi:hypothetical protein [Allomesorhizobium alhagi]|uniref:Uncharacterized protein n=1 Tax=Mesorhizobium alhagi CCNWXJ12-2 TaxID=1107882 RepID=H0HNL1_9HYPH|nr:hypothetical protein [Mesorhizobium alhagi]EHK57664.1 hypothetical protein MAXJ12_08669 [Mesorhizobium alhagi CCNWXJ12-2]
MIWAAGAAVIVFILVPDGAVVALAWAFTRQAHPFMANCSHIVVVGRLKWIPGSEHTGMESVAWYRFHAQHVDGPRLIPARPEKASHVEPDDQPNAERTLA